MFDVLQSKHVRENQDVEGFGISFDSDYGKNLIDNPVIKDSGSIVDIPFLREYYSIRPGSSKTVSFTPLSGIISQSKMIPLKYCPLSFEFELCNDLTDPIIGPGSTGWSDSQTELNYGPTSIDGQGFSSHWQIENPVIKCDVCRMDNELENQFARRFLSGQTIPISYSTFVFQHQALSGQSPSVNITRAASRLKSVFCTFSGKPNTPSSFDILGIHSPMCLKSGMTFITRWHGSINIIQVMSLRSHYRLEVRNSQNIH